MRSDRKCALFMPNDVVQSSRSNPLSYPTLIHVILRTDPKKQLLLLSSSAPYRLPNLTRTSTRMRFQPGSARCVARRVVPSNAAKGASAFGIATWVAGIVTARSIRSSAGLSRRSLINGEASSTLARRRIWAHFPN